MLPSILDSVPFATQASALIGPTLTLMVLVFLCMLAALLLLSFTLIRARDPKGALAGGSFLPSEAEPEKLQFERHALHYTVVWIFLFGIVVVFQLYEQFTADSYMQLCVSLALPLLLQPFLYPFPAEAKKPFWKRYSFKANLWIAIYSFIGNYWYTQYFYSVLKARYSFPSHRLNDVPIALFFATHFYFVTYHAFSNLLLRKIETRFAPGMLRSAFFWSTVLCFSYFTAFMETLTISSFPYYSFADRDMAYTLGSAFYGIYFIVSYPAFYRLDCRALNGGADYTLYQTVMDAMGQGMVILLLLDFCRLACGIELTVGGVAYYVYQK